jgi:hypothetical protein
MFRFVSQRPRVQSGVMNSTYHKTRLCGGYRLRQRIARLTLPCNARVHASQFLRIGSNDVQRKPHMIVSIIPRIAASHSAAVQATGFLCDDSSCDAEDRVGDEAVDMFLARINDRTPQGGGYGEPTRLQTFSAEEVPSERAQQPQSPTLNLDVRFIIAYWSVREFTSARLA